MDRALTLNMRAILASIVLGTALLLAQTRVHSDDWTFYVTSDTCPGLHLGIKRERHAYSDGGVGVIFVHHTVQLAS